MTRLTSLTNDLLTIDKPEAGTRAKVSFHALVWFKIPIAKSPDVDAQADRKVAPQNQS